MFVGIHIVIHFDVFVFGQIFSNFVFGKIFSTKGKHDEGLLQSRLGITTLVKTRVVIHEHSNNMHWLQPVYVKLPSVYKPIGTFLGFLHGSTNLCIVVQAGYFLARKNCSECRPTSKN